MKLADPTFGLDSHAWAILAVLSGLEPDFARFREDAQLYDVCIQTNLHKVGDRCWASLTLFPHLTPTGPRKLIAFGRDPHVDEIVVESWAASSSAPDDSTRSSLHRFAPKDLMAAALFVRSELAWAYEFLLAAVPTDQA
jgi:hypothetical protein